MNPENRATHPADVLIRFLVSELQAVYGLDPVPDDVLTEFTASWRGGLRDEEITEAVMIWRTWQAGRGGTHPRWIPRTQPTITEQENHHD